MKLKDIILKRVSNSKFNNEKIDVNLLVDLLDVAVYAPNHKMREPWRFIIIEGQSKNRLFDDYLSKVSTTVKNEVMPGVQKVSQAPVVVAFIMPNNPDYRDELEDMEAVAMVIQNFMLLATEANLATFLKTPKFIETDLFKDLLGMHQSEIIIGMVMVGHSDTQPNPKTRVQASLRTTFYK